MDAAHSKVGTKATCQSHNVLPESSHVETRRLETSNANRSQSQHEDFFQRSKQSGKARLRTVVAFSRWHAKLLATLRAAASWQPLSLVFLFWEVSGHVAGFVVTGLCLSRRSVLCTYHAHFCSQPGSSFCISVQERYFLFDGFACLLLNTLIIKVLLLKFEQVFCVNFTLRLLCSPGFEDSVHRHNGQC